jgi:sugar phosphate isomerase/epimerase
MKIGLQLYTVRDELERNLEETLRTVASIGYDGVELYGELGDVASLRRLLDELGLAVAGRHIPLDADAELLAAEMEELGCDRVALAWIDPLESTADRDATLAQIVELGERVRATGLAFGFHNHWTEAPPFEDGVSLLQRLPEWIWLELDLGWLWWSGVSPMETLAWARGRTPLVHCKDLRSRDSHEFVPVGDGGVGYESIVPSAQALGVEWLIAEQDELDRPPAAALERSLATLRAAA